ncbi:MAG: PspC domain-containing protein [Kangiellaceae bacterium]|nr:PspC domain-containing protein [Kangiellaceae bacterium]
MKHYHHYKRRRYGDRYSDDYTISSKPLRARSKIMGVCSGIAHQFGWDVTGVRVVAALGLIFLTGPTFLAYIIAGALFY